MELVKGRPSDTADRLEKEIRVYDLLDKLNVSYERVDHEAAMTMEACEEIDRTLGDDTSICKNLFLCNRQETSFYLLLMPGDKPFKTKDSVLSDQLCPVIFRQAGIHGKIPGYYSRLCQCDGTDERFRKEDPAADRQRRTEPSLFWLPSMYQYLQPKIHHQ